MIPKKGYKLPKKIFYALLITYGSVVIQLALISESVARDCPGPSREVKVTVTQDSAEPSLYEYTIVNNSSSKIFIFKLGSKGFAEYDLSWAPEYTPEAGFAPTGWKYSKNIHVHESDKISYLWYVKDVKNHALRIPPGITQGGFKLKMPGSHETMKSLHFKVSASPSIECSWGIVQSK